MVNCSSEVPFFGSRGSVLEPILFILCTTPFSLVIQNCNVNHYIYAHDSIDAHINKTRQSLAMTHMWRHNTFFRYTARLTSWRTLMVFSYSQINKYWVFFCCWTYSLKPDNNMRSANTVMTFRWQINLPFHVLPPICNVTFAHNDVCIDMPCEFQSPHFLAL